MPQEKLLAPNTAIIVIPIAGVADPNAGPTTAEINTSGVNISQAIVSGYNLNPTDPDTDDSTSITDEGNVTNQTYENYELDMTCFKESDLADTTGAYARAFAFFGAGRVEFIMVRRVGKKYNVAFAAGQKIDFFGFVSDLARNLDERKSPNRFQVVGIPTGYIKTFYTLP